VRSSMVVLAGAVAMLAFAPEAPAAGPTITYTVASGTAGDNGWYVSDVTANITPSGATDTSCPAVKTFRSSTDSLDCTATDGTSTVNFHLQFKIDKDKPTVSSATPDRQPNANGWYTAPVNVTFAGSDSTSGIASCQRITYDGPDNGSASVSGTCRDIAGNVSAPFSFALKYDSTAPSVSASAARGPDANGWYNHPVAIAFSGSDATAGVDSCTSSTYSGPDTSGTTVSGSCSDKAGNSGSASFSLQYDATPPTVSAALDRPPDSNGWYNHAVSLKVSGTDALSGGVTCTGGTYGGPVGAAVSLTGTCADAAGNSASQSVSFKYDDTPPKLSGLAATTGNATATLRWTASADTAAVTVARTSSKKGGSDVIVYKGDGRTFKDSKVTNGLTYRYTVTAVDAAGNEVSAHLVAAPRALVSPAAGATLRGPPLLAWNALAGTSYYNVQLFFHGHKVLSVWPVGTRLSLTRAWTYNGLKFTLKKGRYRWYVWPGYGPRTASKYGKLLGASLFFVR
jgi:hypothetical protein